MLESKLALTIENKAGWDPYGWELVIYDAVWTLEASLICARKRGEAKAQVFEQLISELKRCITEGRKDA